MNIVYSGTIKEVADLPFHLLYNNTTFVYQEDVFHTICRSDNLLFEEFNQLLSDKEIDFQGRTAYHLLHFVEVANDISLSLMEKPHALKDDNQLYLSKTLHPLTFALAKIGAKEIFQEYGEYETPMTIFERELLSK